MELSVKLVSGLSNFHLSNNPSREVRVQVAPALTIDQPIKFTLSHNMLSLMGSKMVQDTTLITTRLTTDVTINWMLQDE